MLIGRIHIDDRFICPLISYDDKRGVIKIPNKSKKLADELKEYLSILCSCFKNWNY